MRSLLLLSTAVLLAACADDQHTTAPRGSAGGTFNADRQISSELKAQGKPTTVAGFTKVNSIASSWTFNAGQSGIAHTDCPTGTTIVGGGYGFDFSNGFVTTPLPMVGASAATGTGWVVAIENNQPGAISWTVEVQVLCAS